MLTITLKSAYWLPGFLLLLTLNPLLAQRWQTVSEQPDHQPVTLHGSLLFQGIYSGFRLGIERPISVTEFRRANGQTTRRERAVLFSAGMYYHPGFHLNTFAGAEYVFRHVGRRGGVQEFRTSLAASRTFLGAETYSVAENGTVQTVPAAGQLYAMPGLGVGFGKDYGKTNPQRPLSVMLNLNLTGLLPYNGLVLPTPTLELSLRYRLKGRAGVAIHRTIKQRN
jgi:hypothetical protein